MAPAKTVTVEVLQDHTSDGVPRPVGSQYEINEDVLDYLIRQGLVRTPAAAPEEHTPKAAARKK